MKILLLGDHEQLLLSMYPIAVEFTRHWKEKVRNQAVWPSPHESIYIFHLMLSLCRLGTKKNISSSLVLYSLWSYLPGWGWKYEDFFAHINGKALEMCVWLNKIQNRKKKPTQQKEWGKCASSSRWKHHVNRLSTRSEQGCWAGSPFIIIELIVTTEVLVWRRKSRKLIFSLRHIKGTKYTLTHKAISHLF